MVFPLNGVFIVKPSKDHQSAETQCLRLPWNVKIGPTVPASRRVEKKRQDSLISHKMVIFHQPGISLHWTD